MRENKAMKKIVCGLMAAIMLACAMPTSAFGAETSQKYTIDLNTISDKEWNDSEVRLKFTLTTKTGSEIVRYAYYGENPGLTQTWEPTLGKPVLLNYVVDETTQKKLPITWAPARLVAESIPGVSIRWVEKTDTEEAHAVLHTPKYGDVNLYLNATEIRYGDNVYREQTYTFPDNTPIPLCLLRDVYDDNGNYIGGRIYIPVRGISTFLLDGETSYVWQNASTLNVVSSIGDYEFEKTYGLNTNYTNADGRLDWEAMPNLMAALEGQNWSNGSARLLVRMYSETHVSTDLHFSYYSAQDGLEVKGWNPMLAHAAQMPIIEGLLKDMVCDADREAIVNLLHTIYEHVAPGYTKTAGATQEARDWWSAQPKNYTLEEVVINFAEWLEYFTIKTK